MPPKKKQGSATRGSCSICCQVVLDKDEALFCAGKCQQWLHRYCCSVTEQQYKASTDSKCPFLCPWCDRERQQEEIIELRSTVEAMKLELAQLKESLATLCSSNRNSTRVIETELRIHGKTVERRQVRSWPQKPWQAATP